MARQKDRKERGSQSVSSRGLKDLVKNGRDYSKQTLNEEMEKARGEKKRSPWMKIISVPMGGLNKKK
jgi:hypothetical protein